MSKKGVKNGPYKKSNGNSVNDSVGSFNSLNEVFLPTPEQSKEIIAKFKSIVDTRLDKLYNTRGADGEMYAYGIAVNQVKKKAEQPEDAPTEETPTEDNMDKDQKLKEMIQAALSKPLEENKSLTAGFPHRKTSGEDWEKIEITEPMDDATRNRMIKNFRAAGWDAKPNNGGGITAVKKSTLEEKKKSFPDLTGDGKVTQADILKARGVELDEDLDLGHQDDEPHMVKGELYKIAQNALALYKAIEPFDNSDQEVDFPSWWQSKITTACNMLDSAKSYLEFELNEPQIDAIEEKITKTTPAGEVISDFEKSKAPQFKGKSKKKKRNMAIAAYLSKHPEKVKEAVVNHLKSKK
jgi:hypothetical protein